MSPDDEGLWLAIRPPDHPQSALTYEDLPGLMGAVLRITADNPSGDARRWTFTPRQGAREDRN